MHSCCISVNESLFIQTWFNIIFHIFYKSHSHDRTHFFYLPIHIFFYLPIHLWDVSIPTLFGGSFHPWRCETLYAFKILLLPFDQPHHLLEIVDTTWDSEWLLVIEAINLTRLLQQFSKVRTVQMSNGNYETLLFFAYVHCDAAFGSHFIRTTQTKFPALSIEYLPLAGNDQRFHSHILGYQSLKYT